VILDCIPVAITPLPGGAKQWGKLVPFSFTSLISVSLLVGESPELFAQSDGSIEKIQHYTTQGTTGAHPPSRYNRCTPSS